MTKNLLCLLVFMLATIRVAQAQAGYPDWDKNYPAIDFQRVLQFEQRYADSVVAVDGDIAYYFRMDKYRFSATYLGQKRAIDPKVMQSMKRVFKMVSGDPALLESLMENEYLFQVGETQIWVPVQRQLEKPLAKEVKKGKSALIYCLFLNERSSGGLYNSLLISEFLKE
ncbi:hypothetical protein [uncultured Pontibacter sp.]|uniref:hypothetical protein n=1 Tax=uncultured Pontibacter sp. TaxID=453356 RepID=UPI00263454E1|nr:hypothetical protein [uncultured Pontibacter sp.]